MNEVALLFQRIDAQDDELYIQRGELSRLLGGSGICEICGRRRKLQIDHDHSSQYFRGLLCRECNLGLGHFEDSLDRLQNAIKYLERAKNANHE